MIDAFGRKVSYLRLSVTDRCNLRCAYCMTEEMTFLPKADLLSLEELERVCDAFIDLGVRKIRITGGEPLMRRDVTTLIAALGRRKAQGRIDEVALTTNATRLETFARPLAEAGVGRVNVSLDTLDPGRFRALTRGGDIGSVMRGIGAAQDAGLTIKINTVALQGVNDGEIGDILTWCGRQGFDMTVIETMPLGEGTAADAPGRHLSADAVRRSLAERFSLTPSTHGTGGPSRYFDVAETATRIGFIAPLGHNFCAGCNRVRLTCTGRLYTCLGQEGSADLRAVLRESEGDAAVREAILAAVAAKPAGHDFVAQLAGTAAPLARHMSVTGG